MTEAAAAPSDAIPLIMNPTAGGGRLLRHKAQVEDAARSAGCELEWWLTKRPGHATELARRAAAEARAMVFAYGGDGTYNEVARGLLGSETALAVLPGGTTSVLAYEFNIPRPAAAAVRALLAGSDRSMRVGVTDGGEIFLLMLSAGPDSLVLYALNPLLKKLGGRVGVAVQALLELLRWGPMPRLELTVDGGETIACGWVIVGKSRSYAGPYHATPGADPFSDAFEVVACSARRRRHLLSFALGIAKSRHLERPGVVRVPEARHIRIDGDGAKSLRYQVDGDLARHLPVQLSVDPRPLRVRVP